VKGKAIIVSAPSGAGKTTIVRELLGAGLHLEFSVSACSRPKRRNEIEGKDYYFLTVGQFRERAAKGEFIEWEEVYKDHLYGTLKSELERIWDRGSHIIFDVDVVGGLNLKRILGEKALSIFIMPPSMEILEERLRRRSTEDEASLARRLGKARQEMERAEEFDLVIINEDLQTAVEEAIGVSGEFLSR
jgi:guanylate kinase